MSEIIDETLTDKAAEQLIGDILSGKLPAGHKLRVEQLRDDYGISSSPVREALTRLASLGFVTASSRRGFRVAAMTRDDLSDITRVRVMVETEMLRASMALPKKDGGEAWELGIVAAFARMKHLVDQLMSGQPAQRAAVEAAHKQFHVALVAGSGSPRLAQWQDLLFDQARRYREPTMRALTSLDGFLEVHETLMRLALARDDRAVPALAAHLALTGSNVDWES
jgi:GntR family transcriptional regulator, carbon starvation induced regulator